MQLHRVIEVQQAYAKFEAELEAENKKRRCKLKEYSMNR